MRDRYQYIPFSELEMDEYSRLRPDPERFPSSVGGAGFKPLDDAVHWFHFFQRNSAVRIEHKVDQAAKRVGPCLVVHHSGIFFKFFITPRPRSLL